MKKLWARLRTINRWIANKRGKGKKTPVLAAERKRILKRIKFLEAHADPRPNADGTADWKGRKVAAWMVGASTGPDGTKTNWLEKSVNHGWDGGISSGYRSPEYCESLCRNMCGAPSCPGLCAGRSSNHSQVGPPNWGAIDVYPQYAKFGEIQRQIGSPLRNALPLDHVHYSYHGN